MPGFVYVFEAEKHPTCIKVGVAKNVGRRRSQVDRTVPGKVRVAAKFWFLAPYTVEGIAHFVFNPFNRVLVGSGKTEWFAPPVLLLILGAASLWLYYEDLTLAIFAFGLAYLTTAKLLRLVVIAFLLAFWLLQLAFLAAVAFFAATAFDAAPG
jgi:hypothetical protein